MRGITTLLGVCLITLIGAGACAWTPDIPRKTLAKTYLAQPSDLVEIGKNVLHVRDTGPQDGKPVILIHGFGSSLHTWNAWAATLEKEAFRVIRFDLPGSGLSLPDPENDYRDPKALSLLRSLMDARGVERAALIGNSIGGRLAWRFAAANPDRVERLVLVSPDGFASPGFAYGTAPDVPAIMHASKYFLPRWALRPNLEVAYADPAALSEAELNRYHALLLAPGNRAAMIARMEQTILEDPTERLRSIDVPVLLLWGEKDAMIPITNAQDYLKTLPDAELVQLPNLGHVPQEEGPAQSVAPVLRFLNAE